MEFKAAKCPSCGGDIQLPIGVERAKCMYCGSDVDVERAVTAARGQVNLDNIRELARDAVDAGNNEEAINRANVLLEHNPKDVEALLIKAEAVGFSSTLASPRILEMAQIATKAVESSQSDESISKKASDILLSVGTAFYNLGRNHLMQFSTYGTWGSYITWSVYVSNVYRTAKDFLPKSEQREVLEALITICKHQLEGYSGADVDVPVKLEMTEEAKRLTNQVLDELVEEMKVLDPSYAKPQIVEKGACFIATAATGTASGKMTIAIRQFRNEILHDHRLGRSFCNYYYRYASKLVPGLKKNRFYRVLAIILIVFPAYLLSKITLIARR